MIKKISTFALVGMLALPVMASAANDDAIASLESQMATMQAQIDDLKANQSATVAPAADAAAWTDRVKLSGQVRFRGYNLENMWTFNDNNDVDRWDTFRLKGSLKATIKASKNVTGVIQLTDQTYGNGIDDAADNKSNKMFLDNAYIEARNMFTLPVDLTMGRMNLIYGSGFVILDGNSQFASTSIYFDGIKMRVHMGDNMMLDGLYMKDEENSRDNRYGGDDITLSGGYFTYKNVPAVGKTEAYALNRNDENLTKSIWMYGARLSNKYDMGIDYSAEAAIQRGSGIYSTKWQEQKAWGTKLDLGYTFTQVDMKPRIFTNYTYMSGDDPNTSDKNEGWDVFYGGWPQFGDVLAWTFVNIGGSHALANVYDYNKMSSTGGEAVFSNLKIIALGASANVMKDLNVKLMYQNLKFDETYAGVDDDFGDCYQATVKYTYTKELSFRLYAAILKPGDAFKTTTPQDNQQEIFLETDFHF